MRGPRNTVYLFVLFLFFLAFAGADEHVLRKRQAPAQSAAQTTAPPPPASSSAASQSAGAPVSQTSDAANSATPAPSSPASNSSDASASATSTGILITSSLTQNASVTASTTGGLASATDSSDNGPQLPVQPVISPALGVAGVILMLTGAAYTFIGVRNRWLYIFLSVAYLTALAVTVLLVYVVNPPINNALQGGYFAAAFFPAVVLAGVSLIFTDIVEGLGCLLGGFCVGMWFLTLSSGGLITSQGGRIALICGFAGGAFCLYFSHWTRTPGLIACMSFAGATALVLGVDCFSCAGLKEFWIYLWNLNPKIWPLGTTTYPVTRGMKVEIAIIIILAVFGAMSQMKLWKIVKERREKRQAARTQDQEDREHLEADLGRQLEDRNERERAQWEATYGGKQANSSVSQFSHTEDGTYHSKMSSEKRSSASIRDVGTNGVEMVEMNPSRRGSKAGTNSQRNSKDKNGLQVGQREIQPESDGHSRAFSNPATLQALERVNENISRTGSVKSYVVKGNGDEGHWEEHPVSQPQVKPLPFSVPDGQASENKEDDVKSVATLGETIAGFDFAMPPKSKRVSMMRAPKRTSGSTFQSDLDDDEAGLGVPHIDDRRSSIAATLDGLSSDGGDLPELSRSGTPAPLADATEETDGSKRTRRARSASSLKEIAKRSEPQTIALDADANRRHSMHLPQQAPESSLGSLANLAPRADSTDDKPKLTLTRPNRISQGPETSPLSPTGLTRDVLPEAQSSTALLYRTNEWAKHQAVADTPAPEDLAPPSESGVTVAYGNEAAAPVDLASLQQTAFSPRAPARNASQTSTTNPFRRGSNQRSSSQQSPTTDAQAQAQLQRRPSNLAPTVKRTSSNGANVSPTNLRSPSRNLLAATLVESPIEEDSPYEHAGAASSTTLLGQRQTMLRGRISAMSFADPNAPMPLNRSQSNLLARNPSAASSRTTLPGPAADDDDTMTLAQRRSVLQRHASQTAPTVRRTASAQAQRVSVAAGPHDTHQPARGPSMTTADRESRLAQWRASQAPVRSVSAAAAASTEQIDVQRARLMEERRARGMAQHREEMVRGARESRIDVAMRTGSLVEAHREKLREMERGVGRKK